MQFTENFAEIVIRHVPVRRWILGGISSLIGGIVGIGLVYSIYFPPHFLLKFIPAGWFDLFAGTSLAGAFVIALFEIKFISMIRTPLTVITVSGFEKCVDLHERRFYGGQRKRFYFFQIRKFKSYKQKQEFSTKYFLALVLANGRSVKLQVPTGNKQETTRLVRQLNKFIKSTADRQIDG